MVLKSFIKKTSEIVDAARLTEKTTIDTSEGRMTGNIGDWILFGVRDDGKYFCEAICKNDVFRVTYKAL